MSRITVVAKEVAHVRLKMDIPSMSLFMRWMGDENVKALPHGSSVDLVRGEYSAIHSLVDAERIVRWCRQRDQSCTDGVGLTT